MNSNLFSNNYLNNLELELNFDKNNYPNRFVPTIADYLLWAKMCSFDKTKKFSANKLQGTTNKFLNTLNIFSEQVDNNFDSLNKESFTFFSQRVKKGFTWKQKLISTSKQKNYLFDDPIYWSSGLDYRNYIRAEETYNKKEIQIKKFLEIVPILVTLKAFSSPLFLDVLSEIGYFSKLNQQKKQTLKNTSGLTVKKNRRWDHILKNPKPIDVFKPLSVNNTIILVCTIGFITIIIVFFPTLVKEFYLIGNSKEIFKTLKKKLIFLNKNRILQI